MTKRNALKIPLKSRRRISVFQLNFENRLHRIEQNGVISLEKEQLSLKKKESLKLKESAKYAKQEQKNKQNKQHHPSRYSPSSFFLFATCNLELKTDLNSHQRTHMNT